MRDTDRSPLYVICGLGNPGPKHAHNRHNVGFHCLDRLAQAWNLHFDKVRFKAYLATGSAIGVRIVLAKPLTFVNASGDAVAPLVRWYKVPLTNLLVVHDDLDLPLGKIRLRPGGSAAGHRGMTSIIAGLGTQDFPRLRLGIGRPIRGEPYQYVLSDFTPDQWAKMQEAYEKAVAAVESFLTQGIKTAMGAFN